jgi:Rieske Fe-S protein
MANWVGRLRSRRSLLVVALGAGVAAVTAACGGKSGSAAVGGKVNVGSVNDVRASLANQKYVRSTEGRLFLLPATDNAVIAVSWKCTHTGCTLPPPSEKSGNFECPCHASVFDGKTGIRLGGPANRPLDYMHAYVESGNIIIDTSQVFTRAAFEAEQIALLS